MTPGDETHLRRAIALAVRARETGERPFGSLLVGPDGDVLAEDHNTVLSERDITAHPELKLARWAARHLDPDAAAATIMYTSCQPCGMCAVAIEYSGLGRVVYAISTEQLRRDIDPPMPDVPSRVRYDGPALFAEARVPLDGLYG